MDLSEYVLIEGAARDRLLDLLPAVVPLRVNAAGAPMSTLATALHVASAPGSSHVPSIGSCTNDSGERAGDRSCRLPERPMRRAQSGTDRELLHVAFPPVS